MTTLEEIEEEEMIRGPESQTLYPYPEHSKLVPSVILDTTMGNMKLEVILLLFFLRLLFVFFLHQCSLRLLPRFNLLFGFLLDQTSHLLLVSSLDHQSSLWSFPRSNLLIFSLLSAKFGVNFSHLHVKLGITKLAFAIFVVASKQYNLQQMGNFLQPF